MLSYSYPDNDKGFARLGEQYARKLPATLKHIQKLWRRLWQGQGDKTKISPLQIIVQHMVGAAATFGFVEISERARQLEGFLRFLALQKKLEPIYRYGGEHYLRALLEASLVPMDESVGGTDPDSDRAIKPATVVIVDDNEFTARSLGLILESHDLSVSYATSLDGVGESVAKVRPSHVIFSHDVSPRIDEIIAAAARIKQDLPGVRPLLIASALDWSARLRLVDSPVEHVLERPYAMAHLLKLLSVPANDVPAEKPRILVVDSDADFRDFYSFVFARKRFALQHCDALEVGLAGLGGERPDLVVIGEEVADIEGIKAKRLLDQLFQGREVPTIFIGLEGSTNTHEEALRWGFNLGLSKPLDAPLFAQVAGDLIRRDRDSRHLQSELNAVRSELKNLQSALDQHAIVSGTDATGNIDYVNDRFVEVSGYTRDELIGANHNLVKSGVHESAFYEQLWSTISAGEPWHGIICNRKKDGGLYWVNSTILPLCGADGLPRRYLSIRTEVTEQLLCAQQAQREQVIYQKLLDNLPFAVCLRSEEGVCEYVNEAYACLYSGNASLIGGKWTALPAVERQMQENLHGEVLKYGEPGVPLVRSLRRHDGSPGWYRSQRFPLFLDDRIAYVLEVVEDVSGDYEGGQPSTVTMMPQVAGVALGSWFWDVSEKRVSFSSPADNPLDWSAETIEADEGWVASLVYTDDRSMVIEQMEKLLKRAESAVLEHRMLLRGNRLAQVRQYINVVRSREGQALYVVGWLELLQD